jgi:hypothetical protein
MGGTFAAIAPVSGSLSSSVRLSASSERRLLSGSNGSNGSFTADPTVRFEALQ